MNNLLFDVPKNVPPSVARLQKVKSEHGIMTYHSRHMAPEEKPWCAILPRAEESLDGETVPEIMAHWCRIIEESNRAGYGTTEADAVLNLCRQLEIPVVL